MSFHLYLYVSRPFANTVFLSVDGAGGVEYTDLYGSALTTCQRISKEEKEGLERLWSNEELLASLPQCGPGYAVTYDDDRSCRGSWHQLSERRLEYRPLANVGYATENGRVSLGWDLESELPEEIEEAFVRSLGLLCGETKRLAKRLRRSLPELAARTGCDAERGVRPVRGQAEAPAELEG